MCTLPSTIGWPVVVVAVSSILVATIVAKYSCKDHRSNQDGVGDSENQYKDKADDAELSGFLQFVALLLTEGLWEWGWEMCVCAYLHLLCGSVVVQWVGVILAMMLKMVAGTRQRNPGSQNSTVKMIVTTTLVTKAYLGSLVSVGLGKVCCVTMGI